jgi:hypothetical protein
MAVSTETVHNQPPEHGRITFANRETSLNDSPRQAIKSTNPPLLPSLNADIWSTIPPRAAIVTHHLLLPYLSLAGRNMIRRGLARPEWAGKPECSFHDAG